MSRIKVVTGEPLQSYIDRLRSSVTYAGAKNFLSNTTWLPTSSGDALSSCIGDTKSMKPMTMTILGVVSHDSRLDPFKTIATCSISSTLTDQCLALTIIDPWFVLGTQSHFLQAVKNIQLLSNTVPFPSLSCSRPAKAFLNIDQLYNDVIHLDIPFFRKKVCFFHISSPYLFSNTDSLARPIKAP
jgi:hypothetical protein